MPRTRKSYRAYFSPREEILVRAVAETFKVSMGQFIKGAAIEMARATMEMANEAERLTKEKENDNGNN